MTDTIEQVCDEALQLHGGYGYLKVLVWLFTDCRATNRACDVGVSD